MAAPPPLPGGRPLPGGAPPPRLPPRPQPSSLPSTSTSSPGPPPLPPRAPSVPLLTSQRAQPASGPPPPLPFRSKANPPALPPRALSPPPSSNTRVKSDPKPPQRPPLPNSSNAATAPPPPPPPQAALAPSLPKRPTDTPNPDPKPSPQPNELRSDAARRRSVSSPEPSKAPQIPLSPSAIAPPPSVIAQKTTSTTEATKGKGEKEAKSLQVVALSVPEPQVANIDWRQHNHVASDTFFALNLGFVEGKDYGEVVCKIVEHRVEQEQSAIFTRTFVNYKIEVTRQKRTWTIFRRFSQVDDVDKKLRSQRILKSDLRMPEKTGMKRVTDEAFVAARLKAMQDYLDSVMAIKEARNSEILHNFLGPFQLNDIRNNYFD